MTTPPCIDVTQLLADLGAGDAEATAKIVPMVYDELRAIANRALRGERPNHTLQTTALVHEAYLKLVDQRQARWQDRAHFLAVAAQLMRRILVDHARARAAQKRGGTRGRTALDDSALYVGDPAFDLVALDDALSRLAAFDPQQGRIVELRYFAGLPIRETAEALGISPATVKREWVLARAWLRRELQ